MPARTGEFRVLLWQVVWQLAWTAVRLASVTAGDLDRMLADADPLAPSALVSLAALPAEATVEVMAEVHALCSPGLRSLTGHPLVELVSAVVRTEGAVEVLLGLSPIWSGSAAELGNTVLRLDRPHRTAEVTCSS